MKKEQTLRGIRVVTLAVNVPGPVAAAGLKRLGATVVKIEPPTGDPLERMSPRWYRDLSRGQRIERADLKSTSGQKRLHALLAKTDVLITSTRPASLRRMDIEWRRLHKQFPRLCYVAIVGHAYPHEHKAGHDLTYQASVGLIEPPEMPLTLLADLAAAEKAISATLTLLFARERLGKAEQAVIALAQAAEEFAAPRRFGLTTDDGVLGGTAARYKLYQAKRGWIALAALEQQFWQRLLRELRVQDATPDDLGAIFRKRADADWESWARKRDLPIVAVRAVESRAKGLNSRRSATTRAAAI